MKKTKLITLLSLVLLSGCAKETVEEVKLNELKDIVCLKDTLVQGEQLQLAAEAPSNIDIKWSVSNDLASITDQGLLTVKDKDGSFIVTASYGENDEFKASKLFTIHTPSIKELTRIRYNAGSGYNYTVTWTGEFLDSKRNPVSKNDIQKNEKTDGDNDPVALYEDLVEKGNVYKAERDGYYSKYGIDGSGNEYEGGGYNSPDGYVHNYEFVNGKFTESGIDQFLGRAGIHDYKEGYTGDLSKFAVDEFKIEDSGLELDADKSCFLYDSKKDTNDYKGLTSYSIDYSIPQAVFNTVDGSYANSFNSQGFFEDLTGKISYTDKEVNREFDFKNVALSNSGNSYTYRATFKISDIGTTVIPGLAEQIEKEKSEHNEVK